MQEPTKLKDYGTKKAFGKLRAVLMHRPYYEFELIDDPDKWGFASKPNKDIAAKEFDSLVDVLKGDLPLVEVGGGGGGFAPSLTAVFTVGEGPKEGGRSL